MEFNKIKLIESERTTKSTFLIDKQKREIAKLKTLSLFIDFMCFCGIVRFSKNLAESMGDICLWF